MSMHSLRPPKILIYSIPMQHPVVLLFEMTSLVILWMYVPSTLFLRNWLNGPMQFPATSPLPRSLSVQAITQRLSDTDSPENSRSTPPPLTTQSSATTSFRSRLHQLSIWRPVGAGHTSLPVVNTPLAQAKERNAAAGAPKKNKDYIADEEYAPSRPSSPDPHSQQPPATAPITTEEHGSGRLKYYILGGSERSNMGMSCHSIQPAAALHELILTPVINQTLIINDEEHNVYVSSIFYFPDGSALNISRSKQLWLHDSANSRKS
ncbi:uncharacterized protein F5147DRAFT_649284 [Suillus discolor]|uniref:Uncharacterized protein n=1 Tax=Suillus discolor TaxID=1912936 RepID=A0A9P7FGI0_9AGAM|nr:uncharacterized protein F5147DRAFT_649284 [Suillus discolor]KAG2115853.1 hypothetical protein F5147DRAFT_649284 [Suillus discolor]